MATPSYQVGVSATTKEANYGILMLGEKLAELVSFIGEDKAEALSVHSAIESDFHVCHLKRKCLGFYMQSQCA